MKGGHPLVDGWEIDTGHEDSVFGIPQILVFDEPHLIQNYTSHHKKSDGDSELKAYESLAYEVSTFGCHLS